MRSSIFSAYPSVTILSWHLGKFRIAHFIITGFLVGRRKTSRMAPLRKTARFSLSMVTAFGNNPYLFSCEVLAPHLETMIVGEGRRHDMKSMDSHGPCGFFFLFLFLGLEGSPSSYRFFFLLIVLLSRCFHLVPILSP